MLSNILKNSFKYTSTLTTPSASFSSRPNSYFIEKEKKYALNNVNPLNVYAAKGQGIYVWDEEGKRYMDFIAGISSLNQGHCHPKLVETFVKQAQTLHLTTRSFGHNQLADTFEFLTKTFQYDKVTLMNGGVEATDAAVKLARRWGYLKKGVPDNKAVVLFPYGNFWGRSIAAAACSDNPVIYGKCGPYGDLGFDKVVYSDINDLKQKLESNPNICGFVMEPVQGEAGGNVPTPGYVKQAYELCKKHKVLFISDEIQMALGRTGKFMGYEWEGIKPDLITLGKSLTGGMYPASAVLGFNEVFDCVTPADGGIIGNTYCNNPMAAVMAKRGVEVIIEEKLTENSAKIGAQMFKGIEDMKHPSIKAIQGRGLFGCVIFNDNIAAKVCEKAVEKGLILKLTAPNKIRMIPPLIITEQQMGEALDIFESTLKSI